MHKLDELLHQAERNLFKAGTQQSTRSELCRTVKNRLGQPRGKLPTCHGTLQNWKGTTSLSLRRDVCTRYFLCQISILRLGYWTVLSEKICQLHQFNHPHITAIFNHKPLLKLRLISLKKLPIKIWKYCL